MDTGCTYIVKYIFTWCNKDSMKCIPHDMVCSQQAGQHGELKKDIDCKTGFHWITLFFFSKRTKNEDFFSKNINSRETMFIWYQ